MWYKPMFNIGLISWGYLWNCGIDLVRKKCGLIITAEFFFWVHAFGFAVYISDLRFSSIGNWGFKRSGKKCKYTQISIVTFPNTHKSYIYIYIYIYIYTDNQSCIFLTPPCINLIPSSLTSPACGRHQRCLMEQAGATHPGLCQPQWESRCLGPAKEWAHHKDQRPQQQGVW